MTQMDEILAFNKAFIERKAYLPYKAPSRPVKKMTIVTCMDCRLIELLPQAMGLKNGDAIMIKCAGGIIDDPYGNTMKSILVSLYELESEAVYVIGHSDCGMHGLTADKMIADIEKRVNDSVFARVAEDGKDLHQWLNGFQSLSDQVNSSVAVVKNHPLLPPNTPVYGLIIDPATGALTLAD
ncbi:beta-class carbonic anhydrase [Sporolactobacillus spathodeae]|uniref:carbonic anhydrase n=1 Tax=Sporolactobacillus spathodeae TaxID=1465502 RepID=A0ABS2Q996_9BACL|nr:carbonic anhydrase [Sporolactobacillus spathodeae]MBM7658367.1 carbonic anhydrase [Sporolactobacillus spathodeae]